MSAKVLLASEKQTINSAFILYKLYIYSIKIQYSHNVTHVSHDNISILHLRSQESIYSIQEHLRSMGNFHEKSNKMSKCIKKIAIIIYTFWQLSTSYPRIHKPNIIRTSSSESICSSRRCCPDVFPKSMPVLRHSSFCHRTKYICDVFLPSLSWLSSASFPGYHSLPYCLL